jgi:hypothetical protein
MVVTMEMVNLNRSQSQSQSQNLKMAIMKEEMKEANQHRSHNKSAGCKLNGQNREK